MIKKLKKPIKTLVTTSRIFEFFPLLLRKLMRQKNDLKPLKFNINFSKEFNRKKFGPQKFLKKKSQKNKKKF